MYRFCLAVAILAAAIVFNACEQTTEPPTKLAPDAPLATFANGPDNAGVVVRYDNQLQGLIVYIGAFQAWHGISPQDVCQNNWWNDPLWDRQYIETPSDMENLVALANDVHTYVWPIFADCDYMLANDPVGQGYSNFRETITWRAGQIVVYRWKAQGQLTSPTGDPVSYNMLRRWNQDRSGDWHVNSFIKAWTHNPATGHWYTLNTDWAEALLGGHPVTINDWPEEAWLIAAYGSYDYGIGLYEEAGDGSWVWASGEPVTYTNWLPWEPNNCAWYEVYGYCVDETHAVMNAANDQGLVGWNDIPGPPWMPIVERTTEP